MRSWEDSQAPILDVTVVQVDEDGQHGVLLVREVVVVLVHWKRCSLSWWLKQISAIGNVTQDQQRCQVCQAAMIELLTMNGLHHKN